MNLKAIPTLSVRSVAMALIGVHLFPILFVIYAESFLNQWLPSLFVVLLPLFFVLYRAPEGASLQPNRANAFKVIGIALCSVSILFMISYFSAAFQPPIQEGKQAIEWVVLPGAESMAYVLRLFLQTWLFALVCVMAGRWLKQTPDVSGLLSRFYSKRELLPWILDVVIIGSTLTILTVIVVLACQQLFYVLSRMVGIHDLFAFPQMSIFVFLFSLFIMNKATGFSKRMGAYAKKPNARLAWVYLGFIGFLSGVWLFSQLALFGLPEETRFELAQAFNMGAASLKTFERSWPLLMLSCSLFMVAPLTVLLSRLLDGGPRYLLAVALGVPVVIAAFFVVSFPSVNAAFWAWIPHLHFSTVPISDEIVQFRFSGFSILLIGLLGILLCVMGKGSLFMHTLVALAPTASGRRERRVREDIARYYKLICFMYGIFGVLGVYGLALNVAVYLPTAVTACLMMVGLGLHQRFQKPLQHNDMQSQNTRKICMEVK